MSGQELLAQGVGVTYLGVRSLLDAPLGLFRLSRLLRTLKPKVLQGWMYHGDLFASGPSRRLKRAKPGACSGIFAANTDHGGYGPLSPSMPDCRLGPI